MTLVRLKKLLKKETASIVQGIVETLGIPIGIQDSEGKLLFGEGESFSSGKYPIELEGEVLGWVGGSEKASSVALLLSHLATREFEKKTL